MRRSLWVLFVLSCGHPAGPPSHILAGPSHGAQDAGVPAGDATALEDDLPRLAARAVLMFQAWQHALADAGEDCAKATANVDAVAAQYADVIAANKRVLKAGHERIKALKEALAPHDAEMDAAAEGIAHAKAMAACAGDPAFAKATDRIGGAP
jgi:hypothetical protein